MAESQQRSRISTRRRLLDGLGFTRPTRKPTLPDHSFMDKGTIGLSISSVNTLETLVPAEKSTDRTQTGYKAPSGLGFSQGKTGLSLLASLGDGGITGIPVLKPLALAVLELVKIAELAKTNKEDCRDIAQQAYQLTQALFNGLHDKIIDMDDEFVSHIREFLSDLTVVRTVLLTLGSRPWLSRALHASDDLKEIEKCKDLIGHSRGLFHINLQMLQHNDMIGLKADISAIKAEVLSSARTATPNTSLLVSSTPPPAPALFVGRDDLLAKIVGIITSSQGSNIAIIGPGGMGKTTLSLAVLYHPDVAMAFKGHRYFVPCEALKTAELLVSAILQILDLPTTSDSEHFKSGKDPLSVLHEGLMSKGPLLLDLDNFETPWNESGTMSEVQEVLKRIASIDTVTLVITMRGINNPSGIQWTPILPLSGLQPLTIQTAREMFLGINSQISYSQASSDLDDLLKELEYIPLAITLISQLSKSQSPSLLLRRWRKEKTALLRSNDNHTERLTSIAVSIELSLQSFQISEDTEAVRLLAFISMLPDGVFRWEEMLEKICSGFQNLYDSVGKLCSASLLYTNESGTLKTLSPIRHYIKKKYGESFWEDRNKLIDYYIALVESYTEEDTAQSVIQELLEGTNNILDLFQEALQDSSLLSKSLVNAAFAYSEFLLDRFRPFVCLIDEVIKILPKVDMNASLGDCLDHFGDIYVEQLMHALAREKYNAAFEEFSKVGNKYRMAMCLYGVANSWYLEDGTEKAKQSLQAAELHLQEDDSDDKADGMARCYKMMGDIMLSEGNYTPAIEKLEAANVLFAKLEDIYGQAHCFLILSDIYYAKDELQEAKQCTDKALNLYAEINDRNGEARCLVILARIEADELKYDMSNRKLEQAYTLYEETNDIHGMIESLLQQAEGLNANRKYSLAREKVEAAYDLSKKTGSPRSTALCYKAFAEIFQSEEKHEDALAKLEAAYSLYSTVDDLLCMAECNHSMGESLLRQDRYKEAEAKLDLAVTVFMQFEDRKSTAQTLETIADLLSSQKRYREAREKLKTSHELFTQIGYGYGIGTSMSYLGDVSYEEEKYDEAMEEYKAGYTVFNALNAEDDMAKCLCDLGKTLREISSSLDDPDYSGAKNKYTQALALYDKLGWTVDVAEVHLELADILSLEEDYTAAKKEVEKARLLYVQLENQVGLGECWQKLGAICTEAEEYAEGRKHLEQAFSIFQKEGKKYLTAESLQDLGNNFKEDEKYTDAREKYYAAYALFEKLNEKFEMGECKQSLGGVLEELKEFGKAAKELRTACALFTELEDKESLANCLGDLARMYEYDEKFDKAKEKYEEAIALFRELEIDAGLAESLFNLGELLVSQGQRKEAKEALKEAHALYEELGDKKGAEDCEDLLKSLGKGKSKSARKKKPRKNAARR